jgi:tRNA(Ile)-lysidine synthase
VHVLAERLLNTIRKHSSIRAGDRLATAVSGGADSIALLLLLLELRSELGIVLSVAHVNHKLRNQESDEDASFVAQLAKQHDLELHFEEAPVPRKNKSEISAEVLSGIEAAARDLRYAFFRRLARSGRVTKIATAHTLDDQAETLLLRIFRGTGIRGLAGIHPQITFVDNTDRRPYGELVRPLLAFRRAALLEYLRERNQSWREDSSNQDVTFLRNRIRHRLLPAIREEFGESAIEHMSELADIASAEEAHWKSEHPEVLQYAAPQELPIEPLHLLSLAARRRVIRQWLEINAPTAGISFRAVEESLELAQSSPGKMLSLSGGWSLRRTRHHLILESDSARVTQKNVRNLPSARTPADQSPNYEYSLSIPGTVAVPELATSVEARMIDPAFAPQDFIPQKNSSQLLDIERLPKQVLIRNWRAGDRYWPSHTAAARKIKELLSDRHLTGAEKKLWPIAVAPDLGIIWMRGFPAPAALQAKEGSAKAIWIRETAPIHS